MKATKEIQNKDPRLVTQIGRRNEPVSTITGPVEYEVWCRQEAERINAGPGGGVRVKLFNDDLDCAISR